MTELHFENIMIKSADLGGLSDFPAIYQESNFQAQKTMQLQEDDELFMDIGKVPLVLPYKHRSLFNRDIDTKKEKVCILENDALRATFLPNYGGRLWSLYDKIENKELLYNNKSIKFGNLALRNAWFAGGVEWNVGLIGHSPHTCEPLHTAHLKDDDGNPVLRFYAFERIREIVYQMDFSLPEGSKVLLARMRIRNPHYKTIPMYWWSNMALPEKIGARIVVPAETSFISTNTGIDHMVLPFDENNIDISYPTNTMNAKDYFYRIDPRDRKYIAYFNPDGYGFFQTSTFRLRGRKLFIWGQGSGSETWQNWLNDKDGRYIELQAGLGQTQYECIPMPPYAAWEWTEAYGAVKANPSAVFGEWGDAQKEAKQRIERVISDEALERYHKESKKSIALKKGELIMAGDGWGALEQLRRKTDKEETLEPHLDFGAIQEEQADWLYLLNNGIFPSKDVRDVPESYCISQVWENKINAISDADKDWYTLYQKGIIAISKSDLDGAKKCFLASVQKENNGWAHYGLAVVSCYRQEWENCVVHTCQAVELCDGTLSVLKEGCKLLLNCSAYEEILTLINKYLFKKEISEDGRIGFYRVKALAQLNRIEEAENILYKDGGLIILDMREGETSITDLWFEIEEKKAKQQGKIFVKSEHKPPIQFDFRMQLF